MKRRIADGSVGSPHVRVGHRQAHIPSPRPAYAGRGFAFWGAERLQDHRFLDADKLPQLLPLAVIALRSNLCA